MHILWRQRILQRGRHKITSLTAHVSLGNYNSIDVEADSLEDLRKQLAEVASLAPELVDTVNVIGSAGKAAGAKANIDRPASAASTEPGGGNGPRCSCGTPYKDCQGMKTKAGADYKYRYYPACDSKVTGCKPQ